MPLALADRTRLAHVLGLLGSPHQGERDAAALAADRLVRGRGLSWSDVLMPPEVVKVYPDQPKRQNAYQHPPADHLADLHACGRRPDLLTAWEVAFVASVARQRTMTQRQRDMLAEIAAKIRSAGHSAK